MQFNEMNGAFFQVSMDKYYCIARNIKYLASILIFFIYIRTEKSFLIINFKNLFIFNE